MLSFGHAAYFGVGAFATVHVMRCGRHRPSVPTPLLPLAGALAGFVFGLARLVRDPAHRHLLRDDHAGHRRAAALARAALKGLFGGEAGVSTMRMPSWGLNFGSTPRSTT